MAGFLGRFGQDQGGQELVAALGQLAHHESFEAHIITAMAPVPLAASFHAGDPPTYARCVNGQVSVGVYGAPVDPAQGRVIDAAGVLDGYRRCGVAYLESLDSAFVILVADRSRQRLWLVNDRMATVPVHYASGPAGFAFAPEGKAVLALLDQPPVLDATGALEFLAMGHAVGSRTLLETVHLLEPASRLTVNLDSGKASVSRYWDLRFAPDPSLGSLPEATAALLAALKQSLEQSMSDAPADFGVLLTGGYDSRVALALLVKAGHVPGRALTWGIRDDIPLSDVPVARQIAQAFDVPFQYLRYDGESLVNNASSWARVSELGSDNMGGFAAGPAFMHEQAGLNSPFLLNGDQLFGIGGIPVSQDHAIEFASGLPAQGLAPGLRAVLCGKHHCDADRRIRAGLEGLLKDHHGDSPKDLLDYLGYRLHLARWLNNPAFFREPMVSVRRPLLQQPGMDLFALLPESLRVDKRLLVEMQKRHLPEVLKMPVATANCLVDWNSWLKNDPGSQAFARSALNTDRICNSTLGEWLSVEGLEQTVERFFSSVQRPMSRSPEQTTVVTRLRRFAAASRAGSLAISHVQRSINRLRGRIPGATESQVVRRLMLVGLLLELFESGDFVLPRDRSFEPGLLAGQWAW